MKTKIASALIGSLALLLGFYPFFDFNSNEILLSKNSIVATYDDSGTIGNSKSTIAVNAEQVCFSYVLGNKAPYPFAGIKITSGTAFDFNTKDVLTVRIKVEKNKRLQTYFSVPINDTLQRIYGNSIDCTPDKSFYNLRISDYSTPLWWFKNNHLSESTLPESNFSKVTSVCIENNILQERGSPDTICVSSILSWRDNTWLVTALVLFVFVYNFLIFFRHKLRREKKVVVEYKAMEFKEVDEDKLKKDDIAQITAYIVKHYENPDLTLKTIRKALGITENRISMLIRTEYQMGYKEYIHQIKINEAKRLFKESKLNINEVATIVGFGNISTFNRVFKDLEGMTASQYIEKTKS